MKIKLLRCKNITEKNNDKLIIDYLKNRFTVIDKKLVTKLDNGKTVVKPYYNQNL